MNYAAGPPGLIKIRTSLWKETKRDQKEIELGALMVVFWGVGGGNINLHFRTVNVNISDEIKIQIYKKMEGIFVI